MNHASTGPLHCYAKIRADTDFGFHGPAALPSKVAGFASAMCHFLRQDAGGSDTVFIANLPPSGWWIFRTQWEEKPDSYGRPNESVVMAEIRTPTDLTSALSLAMGALEARSPSMEHFRKSPEGIEIAPSVLCEPFYPQADDWLAALSLGMTPDGACVCGDVRTAAFAARMVGPPLPDWIGIAKLKVAAQSPPAGRGLLASTVKLPPSRVPTAADHFLAAFPEKVAGLLSLPETPAVRLALAAFAAGGKPQDAPVLPSELGDDTIRWLLEAGGTARAAALELASSRQAGDLLTRPDGNLTIPEIHQLVMERLEHGQDEKVLPAVARRCAALGMTHEEWVSHYGRGSPGEHFFLSPVAAAWWEWLEERSAEMPPTDGWPTALAEFDSKDMFKKLTISRLVRAIKAGAPAETASSRLQRVGMPKSLADHLMGTGSLQDEVHPLPTCVPNADWVAHISAVRICSAGEFFRSPEGMEWWRLVVGLHPVLSAIDREDAPWSEAQGWLHVHQVRLQQLQPRHFLELALGWRGSVPPESIPAVGRMLAQAIGGEKAIFDLLAGGEGSLPVENLLWLVDTGAITSTGLIANCPSAYPALLSTLPDAAWREFLTMDTSASRLAPDSPPEGRTLELLQIQAGTPNFWSRWQGGLPNPVLESLERWLPSNPVIAAIRGAQAGHLLGDGDLSLCIGALDAVQVAAQCVLRAAAGKSVPPELLEAPGLAKEQEMARWLQLRLSKDGLHAGPPPPGLPDRTLSVLIPLLDLRDHLLLLTRSDPALSGTARKSVTTSLLTQWPIRPNYISPLLEPLWEAPPRDS